MTAVFPDVASKVLDEAGIDHDGFSGEGLITKEELLKHVGDVKVLITPLSTKVDQDVIDAAPNLKLIANFGAEDPLHPTSPGRPSGGSTLRRHLR